MATYTLSVAMTNAKSIELNQGGIMICVAKKMGPGPKDYNVIFQTLKPMDSNVFSWIDTYAIGATNLAYQENGMVEFNPETEIPFQSCMTLDNFNAHPITHMPDSIKPGSFNFKNASSSPISAVVSCSTAGRGFLPIYITPKPIAAAFDVNFRPLPQVVVWMQSNVKTSTMVQESIGETLLVDFSKDQAKKITYGQDGKWTTN